MPEISENDTSVEKVFAYGDSIISILPEGIEKTSWPKTYDEALPAGTEFIGFTSTDGETFTKSVDLTDIDANQQAKIRQIASNGTATLAFTALEDNEVTQYLWEAVKPASGETYVDVEDLTATVTRTIVYDTMDTQTGFVKRVRYVGVANITPNGDIVYSRGNVASRPFLATFLGGYRRCFESSAS